MLTYVKVQNDKKYTVKAGTVQMQILTFYPPGSVSDMSVIGQDCVKYMYFREGWVVM